MLRSGGGTKGLKREETMSTNSRALHDGVGLVLVIDVVTGMVDDGVGQKVSALTSHAL